MIDGSRRLTLALVLGAATPLLAQQPLLPPYKAGFPMTLAGQGGVSTKPALADLKIAGDTAGVKSIIYVGNNGNLHVIHRTSGGTWIEAPGFPVQVSTPSASPSVPSFLSSPAVGDLTGDGIPEIVVGFGPVNGSLAGGVKAFRNNGALLWSRQSLDVGVPDGRPDPVVGTPAIGDVDNDGQNDVVWGATDHRVYFVSGSTGLDKANWPRNMIDTVLSSPVLHDMDGDGRLEIIVGVDANLNAIFGTIEGGCLHVIPATQAPIPANPFPANVGYPVDLAGFPKCINQVIFTDPVVGDIDGDGRPEIVHGTGNFFAGRTKAAYAWKCDGTAVAGWPVSLLGETQFGSSLALANLDGDAALEVVLSVDTTNQLYAIKGNGSVMPGFPKAPKDFFGGTTNAGSPVVADVLGADAALEILVPTNSDVAVFNTAGTQLTDGGTHGAGVLSFHTETTLTNVAVADLDPGDNKIEVVAVSAAPFPSAANTVIHVWNPVTRATAPTWGQYRQGERRTGVAPGTGACRTYGTCPVPPAAPRFNTITPCRVVDTRGTAGVPFGGPALSSGGLRDFLLRNQCNIPNDAKALSINVTVVTPTADGFVRFSPSCQMPNASTINFSPGQTRANNAVLQLGNTDGILTANAFVSGGGSVHLLIDVNGFFR